MRGCIQLRSVPSLWSGIGEQSRSISRGLKINKNSAEGEVFLVDFPSYRTSVAHLSATPQRPEPLQRNRRTIPLNFKGAENQQEFSRGRIISCSGDHRDLHSCPTRRSSDLSRAFGAE